MIHEFIIGKISSALFASKYYRKSDSKRRLTRYQMEASLHDNTTFFTQYAQGGLLHWLSLRNVLCLTLILDDNVIVHYLGLSSHKLASKIYDKFCKPRSNFVIFCFLFQWLH